MRLYIPGTVLQEGHNELVLLEMDTLPSTLQGMQGGALCDTVTRYA